MRSVFGQPLDRIKWRNVVFIVWLHVFAVYALIHAISTDVNPITFQYLSLISLLSGLGIGMAGHRYYAHRSFKARLPLRLVLMAIYTSVLNGSALSYARDHRAHHKWTDKDADPENSTRGFFFSHFGWWLVKKNKTVLEYGKKLDLSDLYSDPIVTNQHKYYPLWALTFGVVVPTVVPIVFWHENPWTAFLLCVPYKLFVVLHFYWSNNSVSHRVGWKPYIKNTTATDCHVLNYVLMGEGDHNYHHAFAHDYRVSELSLWRRYSPTTLAIDIMAAIGLAYDLKSVTKEQIEEKVKITGDVDEWRLKTDRYGRWGVVDWVFGVAITAFPIYILYAIILIKKLSL